MTMVGGRNAMLAALINRKRNKGETVKIGITDVILCAAAGILPDIITYGIIGQLNNNELGGKKS